MRDVLTLFPTVVKHIPLDQMQGANSNGMRGCLQMARQGIMNSQPTAEMAAMEPLIKRCIQAFAPTWGVVDFCLTSESDSNTRTWGS